MHVPLEFVNAAAQVATLIVISATAVAAIAQLRHVRTGNQIAMLSKLYDSLQSPDFVDARRFIARDLPSILRDPDQRALLQQGAAAPAFAPAIMLGNFYENVGMFVRLGIVDRATVCEVWSGLISEAWSSLAPMLVQMRNEPNGFDIWENFEYLAMLVEDWKAQHPAGTYPRGARRLALPAPGHPELVEGSSNGGSPEPPHGRPPQIAGAPAEANAAMRDEGGSISSR